ncbi:isochorismatase [Paracoccus onubensis]|uniref:Isochorismatase n=2 Tax=Paracoccus onubensis TaxID=1675788 RepID=A0A418T7H3_9RHOB|nr:isochorismatase [Paracoccus onubensis]
MPHAHDFKITIGMEGFSGMTETLTDADWLQARVTELIEDEDSIDPEESLIFYGLDSIRIMTLAGELKERGIQVSFEELARNPTLNAWSELIRERRAG